MDIDRKNTGIGEEAEVFLAREYVKRREAMLNDDEFNEQWEQQEAERLAKIDYEEQQAQRSLDGFSAFPPRVLDDERLKSHHVDVLLGLLAYTETAQDGRVMITRPDLDTGHLAKFTHTSRSNLATYLHELKKWKYVMFELDGTWIYGIRWNMNTKGLAIALRRREDFVRVPNPVIHDTTLTSLQRHAYVTLCWLAFDLASLASDPERKVVADTKPFFCTVSLLAKNMHVSDSTAKRALKQLAELRLIEQLDIPARDGRGNFVPKRDRDGNLMFDASGRTVWKMATLRGAKPILLVPPSVRYAKIKRKKSGQRSPNFVVRPNFDMAYKAWTEGGDPGAMEVPDS